MAGPVDSVWSATRATGFDDLVTFTNLLDLARSDAGLEIAAYIAKPIDFDALFAKIAAVTAG